MKRRMVLATLVLSLVCDAKTGWRIYAEKKPNPVTGHRNAWAWRYAEKGVAMLSVGCVDGKPMFRISENFAVGNALNDALLRSPLDRAIRTGIDSQAKGFSYSIDNGTLMTSFKLRFASKEEVRRVTVPMGWAGNPYIGILDSLHAELMSGFSESEQLLAEISYKGKAGFATWILDGFVAAEDQLSKFGCKVR